MSDSGICRIVVPTATRRSCIQLATLLFGVTVESTAAAERMNSSSVFVLVQ